MYHLSMLKSFSFFLSVDNDYSGPHQQIMSGMTCHMIQHDSYIDEGDML